jgi:GTP-binding protein Era
MTGTEHKFGFVALIGAPNVGKSTLLNKLVGQKISIISRRPQTTRHRVVGIRTEPQYQIAFVDTPGLHSDQKKSLNRVINRTAISSMSDVDVILFLIDYRGWNGKLRAVFQHASTRNTPVILLINKIDKLADKSQLLPLIKESSDIHDFAEVIPVSALKMAKPGEFCQLLVRHLPEGPPGFPADQVTDRSERFFASELVREQTYLILGQELPYSIATQVTAFKKNDRGVLGIDVTIWVEKQGQKLIVIGKDGGQLKKIGSGARRQMEMVFDCKVFLNLWVKVKKGWADQDALLRSLGYSES